ncbi:MAG: DNA polymerase I [Acidimicrobiia bacterium]|nr:DNA polymerase I [Acidimicrobiia bacterium]
MSKLLLLDGHSLAYRAFYALPTDLATSSGQVTNAVYGFTSMLIKVVGDERPDHLGVAFDTAAPTFRKEMDATYKAGRKETPDLFKSQLPLIHQVLETLKVPIVEIDGIEADDVIATLAERAAADGIDVIIVTGDRDSYQLVRDPHVRVLYNKRGVSDYALYDEAGIAERTGVTPAQDPEYAALRGDTSDNLPGVPGIGEKTAAKLVNAYGTLEGIFDHLDELPPKQRQNLGEAREQVFHNRTMSILRRDVPIDLAVDALQIGGWDQEAVKELFYQLEFRTLYPRLLEALGESEAAEAEAGETLDVEVVRTPDVAAVTELVEQLCARGERYAIDVDWLGTPGIGGLKGIAIATSDAVTYVPEDLIRNEQLAPSWSRLFSAGGPPIAAHRAKELMHGIIRSAGTEIATLDLDTAVMAYLVDPGEGKYDLGDLVGRFCGIELISPDRAATEGTLDLDGDASVDDAGRQAVAVFRLGDELRSVLESRELWDLYTDVERPLVGVLAEMETAGIRVDREFLDHMRADLQKRCDELETKIHAHAGEPFVVNSVPQLRRILFEVLELTPVKRTKTGPSTDADSLQKMAAAGDHPILADLLKYREVEKLRNTYAEALPRLIQDDGRIHATFNQIATTTGRISSENPNLQNIPVRTEEGRELRRAFVADEGCGLLTADYSQIELRILAHLAEDPGLVDAFNRGADVHTITASKVFHVDEAKVDDFQRRFAKVVNYGLAYGMEAYGLGQRLDIPTDQAREILDAYFESFPNVHAYMDRTIEEAKSRGYTTTILGRRRQITELASDNFRIRQMGERMAQNAPVQGSAADIFKVAMIRMDRALRDGDFATRMILTVHDELVFEVPTAEREAIEPVVRTAMEGAIELNVPLVVDMGFGPSWAEAK